MLPGVKKCKQATCDNVCSVGIKNNKVVTNEKLHEHMRMSWLLMKHDLDRLLTASNLFLVDIFFY